MEIWQEFSQVRDDLIGSILVDLCEIWLGGSVGCKLPDDEQRLTRASVLLAAVSVLRSNSTSLSAGIHMWVQAVQYDLFSSVVFLLYFSILILSLPLSWLRSKSTSLSSGFCIHRPRQYNTIS